jgi:hypothetical protein
MPIGLESLYDRINRGDAVMDGPTRRLGNAIRVEPEKRQLHPWGDRGGGFWVVGVIGRYAVVFNDITTTSKSRGMRRQKFCSNTASTKTN